MKLNNTAAKMNEREDIMRNPKNVSKRPALVIAVGVAPTLGKNKAKANNKTAGKIRK